MGKLKQKSRIKTIREDLGYTQEQFAEMLELSLSGYKKLESGDVNLTLDKVYLLNNRLGLSADYILFGDKESFVDVWLEARKLPVTEKFQMLMRLYTYLSRRTNDESVMKELMERVDEVVAEFMEQHNIGE